MELDYRFEARFTESVEIGSVDGAIRLDNHFDGTVTDGVLAGARVRGTDQVRIRADGTAEIDVRETIEDARGVIAADVRGYAFPHPGAPGRYRVQGFALLRTAVPELAPYNDAVVVIEGTADLPAASLVIEGRALARPALATAA